MRVSVRTFVIICFFVQTASRGSTEQDGKVDDYIPEGDNRTSGELRDEIKYLRRAMGFVAFDCAMNTMKVELELIWPHFATHNLQRGFEKGVMTQKLSTEVDFVVNKFEAVETKYSISNGDRAVKKIHSFFRTIYALVTRCYDRYFEKFLNDPLTKVSRYLRHLALKLHGLTEQADKDAKMLAFMDFALSYARLRHACNGYHHVYKGELENPANRNLIDELRFMGLLSAWKFSCKDMEFINELRKSYKPPKPKIKSVRYSFTIEDVYTSKEQVQSGILPYLNVVYCPYLDVSFQVEY